MIDADFYTWLKAQSGITDLTSTSRIYALILPQTPSYPALTYTLNDGERDRSFDGDGTLVQTEAQIDCWDTTYGGARALLAAVISAIKNYSGTMGSSTSISQTILGEDINVYEEQVEAYRSSIFVTIWNDNG